MKATIGVVLVALVLAACGGDEGASGCEDFRALVDQVQAGELEPTSDEVVDEVEAIGEQLQDDGDHADVGGAAVAAAQSARAFPDDADETLAPVIERLDEACG